MYDVPENSFSDNINIESILTNKNLDADSTKEIYQKKKCKMQTKKQNKISLELPNKHIPINISFPHIYYLFISTNLNEKKNVLLYYVVTDSPALKF